MRIIFGYTGDGTSMERSEMPYWLETEPMRDQNGEVPRRTNILYSYWDPKYRSGKDNFYKHCTNHFLNNKYVLGYRIRSHLLPSFGYGDMRVDYSDTAQKQFAKWLKKQNFSPIKMPKPLKVVGENPKTIGPDLFGGWYKFMCFTSDTIKTSIQDQFNAIRSNDKKRLIEVDQKPFAYAIESAIPVLQDGGALKNEDSPDFKTTCLRSMCMQAGVPYVEELHNHMPTSLEIVDTTDFWNSYHSKTIFWLMRGHLGLITKKPPKVTKNSWDQRTEERVLQYLAKTQPVWREWIAAKEKEPQVLVYGSRAQGFVWDRRMGGEYDMAGIREFRALFSSHQLNVHLANEYTPWVKLDKFKVIFICGQVMEKASVDKLVEYVKGGGKVVIVHDAGRFVIGNPTGAKSLTERLTGFKNVRHISSPTKSAGADWASYRSFDNDEINNICQWANVLRPVTVKTANGQGFECQYRTTDDGNTIYVALLRRWVGWYWQNIERDEDVEKKYGFETGVVTLYNLPDGEWSVHKLLRKKQSIGVFSSKDGKISFKTAPALAGEAMIYKITKK